MIRMRAAQEMRPPMKRVLAGVAIFPQSTSLDAGAPSVFHAEPSACRSPVAAAARAWRVRITTNAVWVSCRHTTS